MHWLLLIDNDYTLSIIQSNHTTVKHRLKVLLSALTQNCLYYHNYVKRTSSRRAVKLNWLDNAYPRRFWGNFLENLISKVGQTDLVLVC